MSKINGDKKRENIRHKRKVQMRLKIAALKQAHLDKPKSTAR